MKLQPLQEGISAALTEISGIVHSDAPVGDKVNKVGTAVQVRFQWGFGFGYYNVSSGSCPASPCPDDGDDPGLYRRGQVVSCWSEAGRREEG